MPYFVPPIEEGVPFGDPDIPDPQNRLMSYYGSLNTGSTVWRDQDDVWHNTQYPHTGATYRTFNDVGGNVGSVLIEETVANGLFNAKEVYMGGHVYPIDNDTAQRLIDAGFGDNIKGLDSDVLLAQTSKSDSIFSTPSDTFVDIPGWQPITLTVPSDPYVIRIIGSVIAAVGHGAALALFADDLELTHDGTGFTTGAIGHQLEPEALINGLVPHATHQPSPGSQVTYSAKLRTTTANENALLIAGLFGTGTVVNTMYVETKVTI